MHFSEAQTLHYDCLHFPSVLCMISHDIHCNIQGVMIIDPNTTMLPHLVAGPWGLKEQYVTCKNTPLLYTMIGNAVHE